MIKVYLKAKTFEELIEKQQMMNVLSGKKFRYNESYFAKSEFYVTFEHTNIGSWKRVFDNIEERFKARKKETKKENK